MACSGDVLAIEPRPVDFYERDEAEALYAAAGAIGPRWRTLIELGMDFGLRPGELFGCTATGWAGCAGNSPW